MDLTGDESAAQLAAAIAAGRVTSREALESFLHRCSTSDLNAVVTVDEPGARRAADECDRARRDGRRLGPLHGVPMTVKEAWAVAGMRSTSGLPEFAGDVPAYDAVAVDRLRRAGAVIFGKTNVPPGITGQETSNSIFGRTVNPHDPSRTPGGSSGGAAAAVAAGLTAAELGSDSGGSIRQPAHCCGIFGHVPTHGVVPLRGHRPQVPFEHVGKDVDLMTAGPLARDPEDLGLLLDVLQGDDPAIGGGLRFDLPPPRATALSEMRVAVWADDPWCPVAPDVRHGIEAVAGRVAEAGGLVQDFRPGFTLEEAWRVGFALWVASSSARTPEEDMDKLRSDCGVGGLRGARARAETLGHREWLLLDEHRHDLQRRWLEALEGFDVVLCPTSPVPAVSHDRSGDLDAVASVDHRIDLTIDVDGATRPYLDQITWNIVTGLAGLPSTVAPTGVTSAGLPVGVQIVGGRYADRQTIAFASALLA